MKFNKSTVKIIGIIALVCCVGFSISKIIASSKGSQAMQTTHAPQSTVGITPGKVYEIIEVSEASEGRITNFFFNDDNGNRRSLMDITNEKFTFLNFWGTWCPPCRAEIPAIIELQRELEADGLIVIGVALERVSNPMQVVSDYARNREINYINFIASTELTGKLTATYGGIKYVPTTLLINQSGEIFDRIQGARSKEQFKSALDRLMR